jgi:hypothetical protein
LIGLILCRYLRSRKATLPGKAGLIAGQSKKVLDSQRGIVYNSYCSSAGDSLLVTQYALRGETIPIGEATMITKYVVVAKEVHLMPHNITEKIVKVYGPFSHQYAVKALDQLKGDGLELEIHELSYH